MNLLVWLLIRDAIFILITIKFINLDPLYFMILDVPLFKGFFRFIRAKSNPTMNSNWSDLFLILVLRFLSEFTHIYESE